MIFQDWRPPTLTTERLTLRAFVHDDAEALFQHARNPTVTQWTLWEPHRTIEDTRVFVHDYAVLRYLEGIPDPYAITINPDPRPVGACGCFWAAKAHRTMELGYWIAEQYWGKGYITEACRVLLNFAFSDFSPERMQARVIDGNNASERVLTKLGFRHEGMLRRSLVRRGNVESVRIYSILREEWVKTNSEVAKTE